jgi:hypothetical protein
VTRPRIVSDRSVLSIFAATARSAGSAQASSAIVTDDFTTVSFVVDLQSVSGSPTSYTLDVKVQYSPDTTGTRWFDVPSSAITTLVAVGQQRIDDVNLGAARRIQVVYTLAFTGGSSPQATFAVDLSLQQSSINNSSVTINGSDIQLGNVQITDDDSGQTASVNVPASLSASSPSVAAHETGVPTHKIGDGVTPSQTATVAQFHNADNQTLPGTAYGLLTGGVAQILNPSGNLDRQRGTGFDGIPAAGVATGAQQMVGAALTTTFNGSVTGNASSQSITVVTTANLKVGDIFITQDNVEYAEVLSVDSGTQIHAILKNNHGNGQSLTWYHYNQARDATAGDGIAFTGLGASATYLFNTNTGLAEQERSAAGELDGASGKGTNIAAGYEYNGGGPLLNTGFASGLNFDRERNLQGKGVGSATQNAGGAAGATSITASSAAATNSLQPGQQIRIDRNTGTEESAYVANNYVPGTAAISLQSALQFTHTAAAIEWDIFAPAGPGLNGFTPTGIGIEEEALFNPVDGKYYIERAATQDNVASANVVLESVGLLNQAGNIDRQRGNLDNIVIQASSAQTATQTSADQTNYNHRGIMLVVDVTNAGTGSITPEIDFKDPVSGKYVSLLTASTPITSNGTYVYVIYPNAPAAAGAITQSYAFGLPRTFRTKITANNANSVTYSIGAILML